MQRYFKGLYARTMRESYEAAFREIAATVGDRGMVLDCGAGSGHSFHQLNQRCAIPAGRYRGVEWHPATAAQGREHGLDVQQWDLNQGLPHTDGSFACVFGLSVLEHLLHGCRFLRHCHRVLEPGGKLVILTPNISTYFTAALILGGRMPSSGPHPDSDALVASQELFRVQDELIRADTEADTPQHRHLVVFSFRVLQRYLSMLGFSEVRGYGFGVYPFPNFMQPLLERIDPYHAHQMVFIARK